MLVKLARLICANRIELVICNMFFSHKALCRNKDNCGTAKYCKVGLDNNLQWTLDVKWHSAFEVDWLVQVKGSSGILILTTES